MTRTFKKPLQKFLSKCQTADFTFGAFKGLEPFQFVSGYFNYSQLYITATSQKSNMYKCFFCPKNLVVMWTELGGISSIISDAASRME